jgi:hypothetical protein
MHNHHSTPLPEQPQRQLKHQETFACKKRADAIPSHPPSVSSSSPIPPALVHSVLSPRAPPPILPAEPSSAPPWPTRRTRGGAVAGGGVYVFAVDVLGACCEGAAVLAAGVALLEAVELEFWIMLARAVLWGVGEGESEGADLIGVYR